MRKKVIALLIITLLLSFPVSAAEKSVSVQIPVSCIGKNSSETFQYQILPETTQFQELESDSLSLKDGETGVFRISYQVPGTYHYSVRQLKGNQPRTAYDETIYSVDVYVTEKEDGTMAAEAIAYMDTEKKECLSFVNQPITAQPTDAQPTDTQPIDTQPVDTGDHSFTGKVILMAISFLLIIILVCRKEKR